MLYDTEVAKMLSDTKQRYDIKPQLVTQAKNMNKAAVDSISSEKQKGQQSGRQKLLSAESSQQMK